MTDRRFPRRSASAHRFNRQLRWGFALRSDDSGFTLIEMICVAVIVGVLMAIAAPGWLAFFSNRDLTAAQDRIYQAVTKAQREAILRRVDQEVNFQQSNGSVQWTTRSGNAAPSGWQNLQPGIQINAANTTLSQSGGVYRIQFDAQGNITGQLGRLTLSNQNGGNAKRCVLTSTILGALRKDQDADCE